MDTNHKFYFTSSQRMKEIEDENISLVVTSPPYPMIEMWDSIFENENSEIKHLLATQDGTNAFEKMHQELDKVWFEVFRVLKPGGIACINIGDATRKINSDFQLFPSHSRIIKCFQQLGFQSLPEILWRKQTNAPNKFMGSGMYPPGAYVTLEHEYILIFRKGGKRSFQSVEEKHNRRRSAYFWEERNIWFSDVWDFKGISQDLDKNHSRNRSAAYPFELAYRLVNMFSAKHDVVLDPFLGTGTTSLACMISERNSIGYEMDIGFNEIIKQKIDEVITFGNNIISDRLKKHRQFIRQRADNGNSVKYTNKNYGFPVVTAQEQDLIFNKLSGFKKISDYEVKITYE